MTDKNSPALADLEEEQHSCSENEQQKTNPVVEIANALENLFANNPDQKTNISPDNEQGLIMIDVLQAHMKKSFNYEFPALIALKQGKQDHVLSVGGFRSNQITEVFKTLQPNIVTTDAPLSSRLMGTRRG
jgi:hypothetical protein